MQEGRIINKRKNNIANILSDGLFSAGDLQGIFSLFGTTGELPKKILLVEGQNDELTLLKEFCDEDKIDTLDCKSANNMDKFIVLPYVGSSDPKPTLVCLLDNDKTGQKVKKRLDEMSEEKPQGNIIKTLFVSDEKGDRMEEVLRCESKKQAMIKNIRELFSV